MRTFITGILAGFTLILLAFAIVLSIQSGPHSNSVLSYDSTLRQIIDQVNFLSSGSEPECPVCECNDTVYANDFNTSAPGWIASNALTDLNSSALWCLPFQGGESFCELPLEFTVGEYYSIYAPIHSVVSNDIQLKVSTGESWGWSDGFSREGSLTNKFVFQAKEPHLTLAFGDTHSSIDTHIAIDKFIVEKVQYCPPCEECPDCNTTEPEGYALYMDRYRWDEVNGLVTIVYDGAVVVENYDNHNSGSYTDENEFTYTRGEMKACLSNGVGYEVGRDLHDKVHCHCPECDPIHCYHIMEE